LKVIGLVGPHSGKFARMIVTVIYLVMYSIALLTLISLGLAVIFGLMKVINLAHGEFIMLGAYVCVLCTDAGLPLWLAFLAAFVCVGLFGIVVERVLIRFLYGRIIDTLLATWGLSLFMVGIITTVFGPQARSVPLSFGSVQIAGMSFSSYNFVLMAVAALMIAVTWAILRYTTFGLIVRGTMQRADMASALGVNRNMVYMTTFGYGAALAGLAGAVLAPMTGASPNMGQFFISKAFVTVIVGGQLPLTGTISASGLFGVIDGSVSYFWSSIVGEVSTLVAAVLLLRLLPSGITGRMRSGL
jgi:branched-subunit amino acid ABC-type transport system permease component